MISHYITGTTKTQPELGNYLTEKSEFDRLEKWIQGAGTPDSSIRDFYPYDESMNRFVIMAMGKDNWRKMVKTKIL
ncbi:hypothetical protein [Cohnella abietis]|uniref:Uncharacterized protein n=1 Tax=Cohnella abietis TaxID=2507935 RepID=A0A3T1CYA0_9BACL|nr:hypothetical protein [Cohnella abietis]BBI30810.1 hypothetical protein KCTCHS21_02090 [Cohnella abietis]